MPKFAIKPGSKIKFINPANGEVFMTIDYNPISESTVDHSKISGGKGKIYKPYDGKIYNIETGEVVMVLDTLKISEMSNDPVYASGGNGSPKLVKISGTSIKPTIAVVSAIIVNEYGELLLGKRSSLQGHEDFWEFIGGKVEDKESYIPALKREIKEEIDCEFYDAHIKYVHTHEYDDKYVNIFFYSGHIDGQNPKCLEHKELRWVSVEDAFMLNILPSNWKTLEFIKGELKR